ncbi:TPA: HTH domain-containing protein, partial [Candidatus Poribacteria bacterium]|nr:HTH domain-containing protein [Candidatus Poribacteria bacterium]
MKVLDPVLLKETRGEIVNLLKTRQGLSASELAEELELHSMTIRQ